MNTKDHFCSSRHRLPATALYPTQQNWKCLHIRNRQYTEFYISNFLSRWSLDIFSQLGFDVETNSDHKAEKIKLNSVRVLKRCHLNEKNLIKWSSTGNDFTYFKWQRITLSCTTLKIEKVLEKLNV